MNAWERNADTARTVYGMFVDEDDRFYICPCCGDLVYEDDWLEETLEEFMCPFCEDEDMKNE